MTSEFEQTPFAPAPIPELLKGEAGPAMEPKWMVMTLVYL